MANSVMFNTVTTPEQEGVVDLNQNEILPWGGGTAAIMNGLTQMRSRTAAKRKAEEVAKAPPLETSSRSRVDKSTGQTVHDITIKNVQPGNAQADVQQAHDEPQARLAQVYEWARAAAQQQRLPVPGTAEASRQGESFGGRFGLEREAGRPFFSALVRAGLIGALPDRLKQDRERKLEQTADRSRFARTMPYLKEELPIAREIRMEERETERAKVTTAVDRRRRLDSLLSSGALHTLGDNESDVLSSINQGLSDDGLTPLRAWEKKDFTARYRDEVENISEAERKANKKEADERAKEAVKAQKEHESEFKDFSKDESIGKFPNFAALRKTWDTKYGDLSATEVEQLKNRYSVKRDLEIKRQRESEKLDMLIAKLSKGTPDKPAKVDWTEAKDAPTSYLISQIGDPSVDQRTLLRGLRVRGEMLDRERRKVTRDTRAKKAKLDGLKKDKEAGVVFGEATIDQIASEVEDGNQRLSEINNDLESIRRAQNGEKQPGGHKVGDVVTVKGQRVKITKIAPDGTFAGDVLK